MTKDTNVNAVEAEILVETFAPIEEVLAEEVIESTDEAEYLTVCSDLVEDEVNIKAGEPAVSKFGGMPKDQIDVDFANDTSVTLYLDNNILDCITEVADGQGIKNISLAYTHVDSPNLIKQLAQLITCEAGAVRLLPTNDPRRVAEWRQYNQG